MSYFSDLVRSVTGGKGVGETVGGTIGGFFGGPGGAEAGGKVGREFSKSLDEFTNSDVSTAPAAAGVDSPATLTSLSQTSQASQTGRRQIDIDPRIGQGVGMQQAFLAPLVQGIGRGIMRNPGTALTLGTGAGFIADSMGLFDGSGRKLIITRKMQREVKEMFMFMGGDLNATAAAYSNFKMRSYTADNILAIMLKKFSSQGPYVTKAAVRKTRSTLRKMKTLCDITDDLMPKKRAPVRRRATTTTKLVRNG